MEAAARAKVLRQHLHTGLGKGCEASVTGDREWGGVWGDQVGEGGQGHLTQAWVKVLVTGKSMLTFIEHLSWALCYVVLPFFIQQHGVWGGGQVPVHSVLSEVPPPPTPVVLGCCWDCWPLRDRWSSLGSEKGTQTPGQGTKTSSHPRVFPSSPCRAEEVPLCHLLPVWPDPGYPGFPEPEDEGPGLCHLQGGQQRHQCPALHAGLPLLRQAYGERCGCGGCACAVECCGRWGGSGPPVTCSPVP